MLNLSKYKYIYNIALYSFLLCFRKRIMNESGGGVDFKTTTTFSNFSLNAF